MKKLKNTRNVHARGSKVNVKKHISNPQRLIHYCIYCAMEHEEPEMQEEMERFLSNERYKMKGRFMELLNKKLKDTDNKKEFINELINEL